MKTLLVLLWCTAVWAQSPLEFLNHGRPMLDAHNCYPYEGQFADRIDRALRAGFPVGIDIVDKYAHVPAWLTSAYSKLLKHHLGVSLQRGEISDQEMRRVLRTGGRAVVSVWRSLGENGVFGDIVVIAERILGRIDDTRYGFADPDALAGLFVDAGFRDVHVDAVSRPVHFRGDPVVLARLELPRHQPAVGGHRLAALEAPRVVQVRHHLGRPRPPPPHGAHQPLHLKRIRPAHGVGQADTAELQRLRSRSQDASPAVFPSAPRRRFLACRQTCG